MPDGGIYLSNDTAQKLNGDLFAQSAHGVIADQWHTAVSAALPDMIDQAQQAESLRQAADQQQQDQQQRDANVAAFQQQAAPTLAALAPTPSDSLTNPLASSPAPSPDVSATPQADATADTSTPAAPPSAPAPSVAAPSPEPAPAGLPTSALPAPAATVQPATPTTAGLSGGGDLSGRVGAAGQAIMAAAGDAASWLGDQGQKAVQAVLLTEGGMGGARGDKGQSAGPLQFYTGGQLANFAAQNGMSQADAMKYVEQNPNAAVQWAIGTPDAPGYLGAAILKGQQQGLTGPDLATYAQQHGQVSVSPERAGQNWQALFGQGADAISGAVSAAGNAVQATSSGIMDAVKPFLGDAYAWGGKTAATGFDCSGLAGYLTTGQPESTGTLYGKSAAISQDQAQPGDLVFYNMGSSDPHMQHVAVYLGDGKIVQSGGTQADVNVGNADQKIGSPPEFRRVGDGGMPAQAAIAQQQGIPAEASAAAAPSSSPDQTAASTGSSWLDPLKGIGNAISGAATSAGNAVQSGLSGLNDWLGPAPAVDPVASGRAALQGQSDPTGLFTGAAMNQAAVQGAGQAAQAGLDYQGNIQRTPLDIASNPLMVLGAEGPAEGAGQIAGNLMGDAGHLAQPVESAVADAAGNVRPTDLWNTPDAMAGHPATPISPTVPEPTPNSGPLSLTPLQQAQAAVDDMRAAHPQMSDGSVASSGAGQRLAAAKALDPAIPSPYPTGTAPPPEPPAPQDLGLDGWIAEAKARGIDTSTVEAQQPHAPAGYEPPPLPPAADVAGTAGGAGVPPPAAPAPVNIPILPTPAAAPAPVGFWEGLKAYHTGNVVSGLATLTHVTINSIKAPAWSFVTRGAADLASGVSGALTGGAVGSTADLSGVSGSVLGASAAWADSGRAMAQALSDHFSNPNAVMNRVDNPALAGMFKAQQIPISLHAMGMTFAQNAILKIEAGRLAGAEATRMGLSGDAWSAHVVDQIANPTGAIAEAAQGVADRASLKGDLGTMGSGMQTALQKIGPVGNALFPVFKIGANALSQGLEASPIGLAGTGWDVLRATAFKSGPYAGEAGMAGNGIVAPLQERLVNNIAGTALTGWLLGKAVDGSITGAGPSDPAKRAELTAQGWQANSVWTPAGYMDYHAMGSSAMPFALAGSYADAVNYGGQNNAATGDPSEIAGSMAEQMGKYLEDQTGMRQIGQLYDIFHPQGGNAAGAGQTAARLGAQFGAQLVGGYVPESAMVRGLTSAFDPLNRAAQPGDLGQALSMGVPSVGPIPGRDTLPVRQDILGRQEANPQAGVGVLAPRTGTGQPDPMFKVLEDAGVVIPAIPKTIAVNSKYSVAITPAEQQQYSALRGQYIQQILTQLSQTPGWADATPAQQKPILQHAFAQVDAAARKDVVAQIPSADLTQRVMDNLGQKAPQPLLAPGPLRMNVP